MQSRKRHSLFLSVSFILAAVLVCFITDAGAQPPANSPRWDNRRVTVLTPDSVVGRRITIDTLDAGIVRHERTTPFIEEMNLDGVSMAAMGCPCCPEPTYVSWRGTSAFASAAAYDTTSPPCCVPCIKFMDEKIITNHEAQPLGTDPATYVTTGETLTAGIISVYGAVEFDRSDASTEALPVEFDIEVTGEGVVALAGDAGAITESIPSGTGPLGRNHALSFRRDFRVKDGQALIRLVGNLLENMPGEKVSRGVLGIVFLPNRQ